MAQKELLVVHSLQDLAAVIKQRGMRVHDLFKTWDKDRSGSITKTEMSQPLPYIGLKVAADCVNQVFAEIDTDKSGTISFKELSQAIVAAGKAGARAGVLNRDVDLSTPEGFKAQLREVLACQGFRVLDLFRQMDADSGGDVNFEEFRNTVGKLGLPVDKSREPMIREIFSTIDTDHSGTIEYQELRKFIQATEREYKMKNMVAEKKAPTTSKSPFGSREPGKEGSGQGKADPDPRRKSEALAKYRKLQQEIADAEAEAERDRVKLLTLQDDMSDRLEVKDICETTMREGNRIIDAQLAAASKAAEETAALAGTPAEPAEPGVCQLCQKRFPGRGHVCSRCVADVISGEDVEMGEPSTPGAVLQRLGDLLANVGVEVDRPTLEELAQCLQVADQVGETAPLSEIGNLAGDRRPARWKYRVQDSGEQRVRVVFDVPLAAKRKHKDKIFAWARQQVFEAAEKLLGGAQLVQDFESGVTVMDARGRTYKSFSDLSGASDEQFPLHVETSQVIKGGLLNVQGTSPAPRSDTGTARMVGDGLVAHFAKRAAAGPVDPEELKRIEKYREDRKKARAEMVQIIEGVEDSMDKKIRAAEKPQTETAERLEGSLKLLEKRNKELEETLPALLELGIDPPDPPPARELPPVEVDDAEDLGELIHTVKRAGQLAEEVSQMPMVPRKSMAPQKKNAGNSQPRTKAAVVAQVAGKDVPGDMFEPFELGPEGPRKA